jgi:hypothetical protein
MGTKFVRILASLEGFQMEQHIFCIFIDYRGHHRKGAAIYNAIKSIYNRNFGFIEQKNVFLKNTESF